MNVSPRLRSLASAFACLAVLASPAAAERPDRPDFSDIFAPDETNQAVAIIEKYEGDGTRVLSPVVGCFYETESAYLSVYGELTGPDTLGFSSKVIKAKQGAYLTTYIFYSGPGGKFSREGVLVGSCKASVAVSDKDGNASFYDATDQAKFKLSCGADLPAVLGLSEDETEAFVAVSGDKVACKGKVVGGMTPGCFRGDTLVATEHGTRAIRDVQVGDRVWSWNEQTRTKVLSRVSRTHVRPALGLRMVRAGDELLYTTDEHPFWVEGKGWTKAAKIAVGDKLQLAKGEMVAVTANGRTDAATFYAGYEAAPSVQRASLMSFGKHGSVYNIEVETQHNYYVGKNGVLVHNK